MASTESIAIKGQRMYENDSFIVLWSKGLFGTNYPLLTKFYVYVKHRKIALKASGAEKRFLLAVIGEWQRLGLAPQALKETNLFHDFAEAVAGRGGARWSIFFQSANPQHAAESYRPHI